MSVCLCLRLTAVVCDHRMKRKMLSSNSREEQWRTGRNLLVKEMEKKEIVVISQTSNIFVTGYVFTQEVKRGQGFHVSFTNPVQNGLHAT